MAGADAKFERFLARFARQVESLAEGGITLIGSFPEGGPLTDSQLVPINASAVGADGVTLLEAAFALGVFAALPSPAVVDIEKAWTAYEALGKPPGSDAVRAALLRGRLRLQGTDGVRGTVALEAQGNPVLHFGRTSELTPGLVEILCYSFGRMARKAGKARRGAKVIAAEDGRDAATGGRLRAAMKAGLKGAGLTVVDLAVAPTPAVPFAQARLGAPLGVALTASHNPASQNGVKFFIDGFKMLPEGPAGDYALSAVAYNTANETRRLVEEGAVEDGTGVLEAFVDFIVANLPARAAETLAGRRIVFDPANGAFADIGQKVFEKMGLAVTSVNCEPRGGNINKGGGVAELEGSRVITAGQASGSPALSSVAAVLEHAASAGEAAYGLILDGDGDRGYLVAAPGGGEAFVVDGDAEAFILAEHLRRSGGIGDAEAAQFDFIGTVESDLMLFREVNARLGLKTDVGCVGDKWLSRSFLAGRGLAVGEEVSGHVLWPLYADGPGGVRRPVLAGNGLLTTLSVLAAALGLGLSPDRMARPFVEGTFVTRYTYNVNKALFFPGSRAWNADLDCISQALDGAAGQGFARWRVIERLDEPDMLYVGLEDEAGALAGAVFVRNSGTENKTAVYARGSKSLEPVLARVCLVLWKMHRRTLKDAGSPLARVEAAALDALSGGPLSEEELASRVEAVLGGLAAPETTSAVLYGMRKEGLVEFSGGRIASLV